jgi:hypothetical protein
MFYTYAHIRKDTGKIFYIGKGSGRRMYRKDARNRHWHNIVNKVGFEPIVLAKWDLEKDAFEHEKFLIECFKDNQILVNQSSGGDGNNASGGFSFLGKKHSDESILKCKIAHSGKPKSTESKKKNAESHKQKIQINGIVYDSWKSASHCTKIPTGSISYLLSGKVGPKTKYSWVKSISLVM